MAALNALGFGPCYHMSVVLDNRSFDEIDTWFKLGQGKSNWVLVFLAHLYEKILMDRFNHA